jgi:NAD+ synthase
MMKGGLESLLRIDAARESDRIAEFIRRYTRQLKRDGAVVGLSGGIDSAVSVALCVEALGPGKVLGLILPEKESNPVSADFARRHAERLGITWELVDITPVLDAFGTYSRRDQVIQSLCPGYGPGCRIKLSLPPNLLERDAYNVFSLTIVRGDEVVIRTRLDKGQLNAIVAATDTKQRTRMMHLYYYAERQYYLVCGTTNRTELLQGFFVKYGDGGVDIEPLAHLFKHQVYQLADVLHVPDEIINRLPSPDTFSLAVSDEEFYFRMPYRILDPLLLAWERKLDARETAGSLGLTEDQVRRAFRDFNAKHRSTEHLRTLPPSLEGTLMGEER